MLEFEYSSRIYAPVEVVWQFHERPDVLNLLTPPWQPVKVIRREGGLGVGAISEFLISLGPIPVRWISRHTTCIPQQLFTDEQIEGPLVSWIHRHQFISEGDTTRLTDRIEYELPGGTVAETCLEWWVNARLTDMFRYRHQVTQRECEK